MAQINNLRIMQWNCQGAMNKKGELLNISRDFDILLLCETFLKPEKRFDLKNFNIIRTDRVSNRGGGLAIAIRQGIGFYRIHSIVNIENSLRDADSVDRFFCGRAHDSFGLRSPLIGQLNQWSILEDVS